MKPIRLRIYKVIVGIFMTFYLVFIILVFAVGVGARCEKVKGPINSKTYPLSFVIIMIASMLFWLFTATL